MHQVTFKINSRMKIPSTELPSASVCSPNNDDIGMSSKHFTTNMHVYVVNRGKTGMAVIIYVIISHRYPCKCCLDGIPGIQSSVQNDDKFYSRLTCSVNISSCNEVDESIIETKELILLCLQTRKCL